MWRDEAYLLDMLIACRKIVSISHGLDLPAFQADEIRQLALLHLLIITGEAARKISPEFQAEHPEIPWREISGLRNRIVHEYFQIVPERVWEAVSTSVPKIIPVLESLVPPEDRI